MHKKCLECGNGFHAKRNHAKFCSPSCRIKYWEKMHPRIDLGNMTVAVIKKGE